MDETQKMKSTKAITFAAGPDNEDSEHIPEKTLVLSDDEEKFLHSPNSPRREVSPKLVKGSKKYGRRSRPQSLATDSSKSDSDDHEDISVVPNIQCEKSEKSSQNEFKKASKTSQNRRRRPQSAGSNNNGGTKLKRCASLPAQNRQNKDQFCVKQKHVVDETKASSVESLDFPTQLDTIPINSLIEMWESSQISDARGLLNNLGFEDDSEINIAQLMKVLDEELRGLQIGETQTILLKASLILQKAEITFSQQSFRQLYEENKKLDSENKDVNRRANLLAQEVDERHANLELTTKTEIRLLEQRHAEVVKELTEQMQVDRENWSNITAKLEAKIKTLEKEEQRHKLDMHTMQEENSALEKEHISLQKQVTELLETNIKLNNEIVEIDENHRTHSESGSKDTEEVLELIDKITVLQIENTNLRDKNDELTAELESVNIDLQKIKMKKSKSPCKESSNEILSDDPEHSSSGVKRRGDSPSKAKLTEESPRTGKLRKCNDGGSESETSGDWVALNSELNSSNQLAAQTTPTTTSGFSQDFSSISVDSKDDENKYMKEKIAKLEQELNELLNLKDKSKITNPNSQAVENQCKELEASLEQMRRAYEDCEDYWQSKLNDERQMFDKERQIYEDEQQESDKKFSELMEKVREYEDQFAIKDGRLSPIPEKDALEQQFVDLEHEVEETREASRKMLEEKMKEIEHLRMNVLELRMRLGDSVDVIDVCLRNEDSPASSPISYLWNQSTIQAPARDYQNPNWNKKDMTDSSRNIVSETTALTGPEATQDNQNNSSTTPIPCSSNTATPPSNGIMNHINPIQKPIQKSPNVNSDDSASNGSTKSFETHSVASTHSVHKSLAEISTSSSPNSLKEELKRLKFFEVQLREQIKDLALKRDSLVMELQQLQEAKPVLEKAYARAAHPTLIQRVTLLEQKNRHLQNVLRQQQQYTESIMQQSWQQQRAESSELRARLETQNIIITDQAQRLANADMLVKDLYVENSHLTATVQRLEQQQSRANLIHQHQQQQHGLRNGLPGMP